jgi:hypothetical protein
MITKSRRLTYLCIGVTVLLAAAKSADGLTYEFYRLNSTPGGWETSGGYYKVYKVGLHTALSDFTYYSAGTNCGNADHKPGSADWPEHLHVHRDNDSSSPWVAAFGVCFSGSKAETKKYYETRILNNGSDPKVPTTGNHQGLDDGQDDDSQSGDPNFVTNCYGYAFQESGIGDFNDIILVDGSTGADRVVSSTAALYEEHSEPTNPSDNWIMYIPDHHANYLSHISTNHCELLEMKFKYQVSQVFEYEYDAPGRDTDDAFWGLGILSDVDYYEKE